MSSCFENCIGRLQDDENRNKITSIVAGSFVSLKRICDKNSNSKII